jgi:transposase
VGKKTGPNPTDRRKLGSKHHLLTDGGGIPLAAVLTPANRNDVTQIETLVEAIPSVAGRAGHPRKRPEILQGDRAYQSAAKDRWLRKRRIKPLLAKRNTPHGSGLGKTRWVVERSISWLHRFRRLRVRYERRADIHEAFLAIGCALICWKCLTHIFC